MYPAAVIANDAPDNIVPEKSDPSEKLSDNEIVVISSDSESDSNTSKVAKDTDNSSSSDSDFPARVRRFRKTGGPKWTKSYIFDSDTSESDTTEVNLTSSHGTFVVGSDISSDEAPTPEDLNFVDDTKENPNVDSHRALFNKISAKDDDELDQIVNRLYSKLIST